jgi:hypothetical protein
MKEEKAVTFLKKSNQKTVINSGPVAVSTARSRLAKFFLLPFCSQKRSAYS